MIVVNYEIIKRIPFRDLPDEETRKDQALFTRTTCVSKHKEYIDWDWRGFRNCQILFSFLPVPILVPSLNTGYSKESCFTVFLAMQMVRTILKCRTCYVLTRVYRVELPEYRRSDTVALDLPICSDPSTSL